MTCIFNVNSITINGNKVSSFAQHYNPYNKSKDKTLISQQALEEALTTKDVPCDYTFSKQHELNLTFRNVVAKREDSNFVDITYGIQYYLSSDNIGDKIIFLNEYDKSTLYVPPTIKIFDTNESYSFRSADNVVTIVSRYDTVNMDTIIIDSEISASIKIASGTVNNLYLGKSPLTISEESLGVKAHTFIGVNNIYLTGTYKDYKINSGNTVRIITTTGDISETTNTLHLGANFFNGENIDEATEEKYGMWYSSVSNYGVKNIEVDCSNLYTAITDETELIAKIKSIMGLTSVTTVTLINFE